jgi:hypothetical protein
MTTISDLFSPEPRHNRMAIEDVNLYGGHAGDVVVDTTILRATKVSGGDDFSVVITLCSLAEGGTCVYARGLRTGQGGPREMTSMKFLDTDFTGTVEHLHTLLAGWRYRVQEDLIKPDADDMAREAIC